MKDEVAAANPLGTRPIHKLLLHYALPSVVSMLVMSIYNIVDQIFIGRSLGYLGNGATTVAFPLVTVMLALALLIGNGAAASTSLELGRGNREGVPRIMGNAFVLTLVIGVVLATLVLLNLETILWALAATEENYAYAWDYTGVIVLGAPFAMISSGLSNVIRADGSPRFSMIATLSGALLNIVLDPIFIFTLDMGVKGAAIATVLSQVLSSAMVVYYLFFRSRFIRFSPREMKLSGGVVSRLCALGSSSFATQSAITVVNVVLNRSLTYYGAQTSYGPNIPLSAMGVVMKINAILISLILGVAVGCQPILGYNYGAKNYKRVIRTYRTEIAITFTAASVICALFILVPELFIAIFGDANADFNEFAATYLRTFLCCVFCAGIQIPSANYFQAVGKPIKAMILAMTRQLFLMVTLVLILPMFFGLQGILYAGPASDVIACIITCFFILSEMRNLRHLADLPPAEGPQPESERRAIL